MDQPSLYEPREVDRMLRLPRGRIAKLAREGLIVAIILPDGEIRVPRETVEQLLTPQAPRRAGRGFMRLAGSGHAEEVVRS